MSKLKTNYGNIISGTGDINGDGMDDVIVANSVSSYVLFGSNQPWSSSVYLNSLDGKTGFTIKGNSFSVSGTGDVNGDGLDDFLVSDIQANNYTGKTSVIFGAKQWPALIDLDNNYLNGKRGFTINGIHPNDKSGYAVSGAGDINGDNIDDILIGAPGFANQTGQSYVVFGIYI